MVVYLAAPCVCFIPGESPELDKLRAVHRLVENHEAVTKFAARGCGQQGSPPVNAPLSDPYAKPGMQYLDAVDAGQSCSNAHMDACMPPRCLFDGVLITRVHQKTNGCRV